MPALSHLSPNVVVKASRIHGRGLFAREPPEGESVCVKGGHVFDRRRLAEIVFVAMRDVEAGEELTHDWATTDDDRYEIACACGASACRGVITGQDWRKPELPRPARARATSVRRRRARPGRRSAAQRHPRPEFSLTLLIERPRRHSSDGRGPVGEQTAGRMLGTVRGQPGFVHVWDVETFVQVGALLGHRSPVASMGFSPDGSQLATGDETGMVRPWDLSILAVP